MTWIKPSFLWMMYRSDWGSKPGQEHVLRIGLHRAGFDWALEQGLLTHHSPELHGDAGAWKKLVSQSSVLVQWDPERDIALRPLSYRTIQIGLRGQAIHHYVNEWISSIDDVTELARAVRSRAEHDIRAAHEMLPVEQPYPVDKAVARRLNIS